MPIPNEILDELTKLQEQVDANRSNIRSLESLPAGKWATDTALTSALGKESRRITDLEALVSESLADIKNRMNVIEDTANKNRKQIEDLQKRTHLILEMVERIADTLDMDSLIKDMGNEPTKET